MMVILLLALGIGGLILEFIPSLILLALAIFTSIGFVIVAPNESCVLVFFGRYVGTIKSNGFYWVNPLNLKRKISLRARNFNNEPIKVNDKVGNPIMIGLVLV